MEIIVANLREAIAYYQELDEWVRTFDMDPDDPMFDELALMEGDPDKIKCGRNELYFFDIDLNGRKFILTHDEVCAEENLMLRRFHDPDWKRWYESLPCDWAAFEAAENAIAYRGGSGYYYAIWKYTGDFKQSQTKS
jgi:hypothetical protein